MLKRSIKKYILQKLRRIFRRLFYLRYHYYYNISSAMAAEIMRGMPQLSVEFAGGRSIDISKEDIFEYERYKSTYINGDKEKFKKFRVFVNQLEAKYLPRSICFRFNFIGYKFNIKKLECLLREHLWNSDNCNYSLDDIEITQYSNYGDNNVVYVKLYL